MKLNMSLNELLTFYPGLEESKDSYCQECNKELQFDYVFVEEDRMIGFKFKACCDAPLSVFTYKRKKDGEFMMEKLITIGEQWGSHG